MSTMIQIRNVPENVHRRAKVRAAMCGMTMSEYILRELVKALERPTREELLARIANYPELELSKTPAELIREERESR
jgi:plasmid stability protein